MATSTETNVELLALDPDALAEKVAASLRKSDPDALGLTYSPTGTDSYYRDLLALRGFGASPGAHDRLQRHAEEAEHVSWERRQRSERLLRSGSFEFRVEPSRIDGQGGYLSPPAWLNQLFATANRPRRVLAGLMPTFPLPPGVSSVNLPIIGTGAANQVAQDKAAVPDQDFTDTAGSSPAVPFEGQVDLALQLLEMSPPGAHLDWAIFQDLSEAYDAQLETQLLFGAGGTSAESSLTGVMNVSGINAVAYTGAATGAAMYPSFGKAIAQVGDNRDQPPECFLMRTARWAWVKTSEDTATLPFDLTTPFFLGNTDDTPDPIGGIANFPVFLNDAIPANLTATTTNGVTSYVTGGTQDVVICLRPRDLILLEGEPQTLVTREPLSGSLGARIQMHSYAAAITGRHAAGISVVSGSGLAVAAGF